jgi:AcrR family transcriptional regulator
MDGEAKPLRADAQRNRERVLAAAEMVLARDGTAASMRTIAAEAGVGLGTIYRQFATKEALVEAIVFERARQLIELAEELANAPDPGVTFFEFFSQIVEFSTRKRSLTDALPDPDLAIDKDRSGIEQEMRRVLSALLERAQAAHAVRGDFGIDELLALLLATSLAAEKATWSDEFRERTLGFVFDGIRYRTRD